MAKVLSRQMSAATRGSIMRVDCAHTIEQLDILLRSCGDYITDSAREQINKLKETLVNPSALIDDINVETFRTGEKDANTMPTYKLCRVRLPEYMEFDAPTADFRYNDDSYSTAYFKASHEVINETNDFMALKVVSPDAFIKDGVFNIGYSDGVNFHILDIIYDTCTDLDIYINNGKFNEFGADEASVRNYLNKNMLSKRFTYDDFVKRSNKSVSYYKDMINYLLSNKIKFIEDEIKLNSGYYGRTVNYDDPIEGKLYRQRNIVAEIAVIPLSKVESFKNKLSEKSSLIQDNHILWDYMSRIHQ